MCKLFYYNIIDMDSIITKELDNGKIKIKKKKSPKNFSLKTDYKNFLNKKSTKNKKKSSLIKKNIPLNKKKTPPNKKKSSLNKKIKISVSNKNPIFIKSNNVNKSKERNIPQKQKSSSRKSSSQKSSSQNLSPQKQKSYPQKKLSAQKNKINSKKRFSKKNKRRKLSNKHTKSRKISFRCYPQKDKNINDVIKKANKLSEEEMKKELLSNGIEIKGNKNKLLKDIYMFSSMGGIKIQKQ